MFPVCYCNENNIYIPLATSCLPPSKKIVSNIFHVGPLFETEGLQQSHNTSMRRCGEFCDVVSFVCVLDVCFKP